MLLVANCVCEISFKVTPARENLMLLTEYYADYKGNA